MWLFVLFLTIPMIEIALFIKVGGLIGLWWTLAIVIATAVAGSYMMRLQGIAVLGRLRSSLQDARDPTEPIANGALILFSGALLLTPGFFTDAVGLLLLIPAVRSALIRYLARHIRVEPLNGGASASYGGQQNADIIEGEAIEVDPEAQSPGGTSGWTRH